MAGIRFYVTQNIKDFSNEVGTIVRSHAWVIHILQIRNAVDNGCRNHVTLGNKRTIIYLPNPVKKHLVLHNSIPQFGVLQGPSSLGEECQKPLLHNECSDQTDWPTGADGIGDRNKHSDHPITVTTELRKNKQTMQTLSLKYTDGS